MIKHRSINPFTLSNFSKALFSTGDAKRFKHHSVYTTEKYKTKKALEERIQEIRGEQGEATAPEEYDAEKRIRGTFIEGTSHLMKRKMKDGNDAKKAKKRLVWPIIFLAMALIIFYYITH